MKTSGDEMPRYRFETTELLFALRLARGLTQQEFSQKVGMSQATISKYEKGVFDEKNINVFHIKEVYRHFNIDMNDLMKGLFDEPLPKTTKTSICL